MTHVSKYRWGYETVAPDLGREWKPGCICRAPIRFVDDGKYVSMLHVERDPHSRPVCSYTLDEEDLTEYKPTEHPFHAELGLREGQFIPLVGHKFRPVVILTERAPEWSTMNNKSTDCYLVAPVYRVRNAEGGYKYGQRFLVRVQTLEFPNLVHLPHSDEHHLKEGLLRLDYAQPMPQDWLRPMMIRLNELFFGLVSAQAIRYINVDMLDHEWQSILDEIGQEFLPHLQAMPPLPD